MAVHLTILRAGPRIALMIAWVAVVTSTLCIAPVRAAEPPVLLTDPFLQKPGPGSVEVAWFTEFAGDSHHVLVGAPVGDLSDSDLHQAVTRGGVPGVRVFTAQSDQLSRVAEDADSKLPAERKPAAGIAAREVFRHHAVVTGAGAAREPYRVLSSRGGALVASDPFTLRGALGPDDPAVILLTSDLQLKKNTPANLELAARTIGAELGPIDAVLLPGDLVNVPDRASEWFDDERGAAFFPVMQGRGGRTAPDGTTYRGGQIIQHAPVYPALGNHEVQGRRAGHTSLQESFDNPVPLAVAEAQYDAVADVVNPTGDPAVRARWIEDNSFSTTTYEEIFSLPASAAGAERYYATTVAGVRVVSLFATRIWRPEDADPQPQNRTVTSRFQEARDDLAAPLSQGYGAFIFDDLSVGARQYDWLLAELNSAEFRDAEYTVVMMHESPQGLGENMTPPFAHPQRIEERDDAGMLTGIRYEYPAAENILVRDVMPVLEAAGVDLVHNGHSHLWNRFVSADGVNYLEASNTGNSYGAYVPESGKSRPVPPAPWDGANYLAQGSPGGLPAVVPTVAPLRDADGRPLPYIADNDLVVFQAMHTGTGAVTSWYVDMADPDAGAVRFDEFRLRAR
ncbi:MAG: metallophosphoesterase [Actinomycetota bacterium]|nr:metallophosphoesterase [Actinomycetota bacterium]